MSSSSMVCWLILHSHKITSLPEILIRQRLFKGFMKTHCHASHYMFQVKKCTCYYCLQYPVRHSHDMLTQLSFLLLPLRGMSNGAMFSPYLNCTVPSYTGSPGIIHWQLSLPSLWQSILVYTGSPGIILGLPHPQYSCGRVSQNARVTQAVLGLSWDSLLP